MQVLMTSPTATYPHAMCLPCGMSQPAPHFSIAGASLQDASASFVKASVRFRVFVAMHAGPEISRWTCICDILLEEMSNMTLLNLWFTSWRHQPVYRCHTFSHICPITSHTRTTHHRAPLVCAIVPACLHLLQGTESAALVLSAVVEPRG
jgi:hypothetical protein